MDIAEVKQRQSYAWGLGDYSWISKSLEPAAQALCAACGVGEGQEVLDVAAGDGNFAVAAARAGARVVASDISPVMLERGRVRTEREGLDIEWLEADAEELPFEDDRFDCVGSVFGAMLAPRPERMASELFRVTRPGGVVGMTAWTPESFSIRMFEIARRYQPPGPDLPLLEEWGEEETVRRRFGDLTASLELEHSSVRWEAETLEKFSEIEQATPMCTALQQAISHDQLEALGREQRELVLDWTGGAEPISIEVEYLMIVARKPEQP